MSKSKSNQFIDTVDECLTNGVNHGLFHINIEDNKLDGRTVHVDKKELVNFSSCSYLGLETDSRLKEGAIDAVIRYGTQYSSSRAYSKCPLYEELEFLFQKIYGHKAIVAPTTTLTHVAAIPILIGENDLIINDHQVHASVQIGTQLAVAKGVKVDLLRHNDLNKLESILSENHSKYNKIWYMVDGLYSMYGDFSPLKDIQVLLQKYPNFYLYVDDAHGMSWIGEHGRGFALSQLELTDKIVVSTSLAKGFGSGGGVLILNNNELCRKILTCGTSYTTGGPLQPPTLGASIASAKIHLSSDIYVYQNQLTENIKRFIQKCDEYALPLISHDVSPIKYIGLGLPRVGYNMVKRLMHEGFFTNVGIFPGVPVRCAGIRVTINRKQTTDDIDKLVVAISKNFASVLEEENQCVADLERNFKTPMPRVAERYPVQKQNDNSSKFYIKHVKSIHEIDKKQWNDLLADNGTYDWEGCRFLEETFCDNPEPENNWNFHYLIISDTITGKPILATFFTELITKDDMIAPANISKKIEEIRKEDKYYLTSKVVTMGSLITEGNHLYLDRNNPEWKQAMVEMIRIMNDVKQACGASAVHLRDLESNDTELRDFLIDEGFIKLEMPDSHIIENLKWDSEDTFLNTLTHRSRAHLRKEVLKNQNLFEVEVGKHISDESMHHKINLYKQVKDRAFAINTFALPDKFFHNVNKHPSWEIIKLKNAGTGEPLAFGLCYISPTNNYTPLVLGMDYEKNNEFGSYRQMLYQAVKAGAVRQTPKLYFGFGADMEKHKFGTRTLKKSVYVQANDTFNMELIGIFSKHST